jgi:hypothetical protein
MTKRLHLLTEFYTPASKERGREINACLLYNLQNPKISQISVFIEADSLESIRTLTDSIETPAFLNVVIRPTRPTYAAMLAYASAAYDQNKDLGITIIANSDIYFEGQDYWDGVTELLNSSPDVALALTRFDVRQTVPENYSSEFMAASANQAVLFPYGYHSQDTWIFSSKQLDHLLLAKDSFNFKLGRLGCDNRFARILIDHGFRLLNTPHTVKTFHLHRSGYRVSSSDRSQTVPGPYARVQVLPPNIPFPDKNLDYLKISSHYIQCFPHF